MVNALTNKVYTPWGKRYNIFNWNKEWDTFIKISDKEVYTKDFTENKHVRHIIYWYDTNILQRISIDSKFTLDVRIRIVCGMINKLNSNKITFRMKIIFMECIWDTYREFTRDYSNYYCKNILNLPF